MYYPKSEILAVNYTSGNELVVKKTNVPYSGYYYATNDGRFFSGKEYSASTVELIRPSINITANRSRQYDFHYPIPSDEDYARGFIVRFVIKRVNSGIDTITEVDQKEFDRASKDPLYVTASFSWKISGPLLDDLSNPQIPVYGVIDTNRRTLDKVEKTIQGIKIYFKNLAQYAK